MEKTDVRSIHGEWYISKEIAAQLCRVSVHTYMSWLGKDKENPPPYNIMNLMVPARELGQWIRDHQVLMSGGRNGKAGYRTKTGEDQAERHKRLQADKIEMSLMTQAKDLVPASEVTDAWMQVLTLVKTRLMKIPTSLAPMIHGEKDVYAIQERLDIAIREALEELCDEVSI